MRRSVGQLAAAMIRRTAKSTSPAESAHLLWPAVASQAPGAATGAAAWLSPAARAALHRPSRGLRYMALPPRFQPPRSTWRGSLDPNASAVVWTLIAANGGVYLLWRTDPSFASRHFVVSLDALRAGRVWTAVTSAFSQQDTMHLASNMISLYFFGSSIGRLFGGRQLLTLYLAGGLAGSLAHCGWQYYKEQGAGLRARWGRMSSRGALGASAAVNAIVCVDVLLFPTRTILLYGLIPMPAALLGLLWLWNDLGGALDGGGSTIAHAGHLGGAATGLLFFLAFKRGRIRPSGW